LLSPVAIGCSHEHAASLQAGGIHRLLIVNGHCGNYVLSNVMQEASTSGPVMALFPSRAGLDAARQVGGLATDSHTDMHVGELETSILLQAMPDVVGPVYRDADHEADDRLLLTLCMAGYTKRVSRPTALLIFCAEVS
jgi:creatinine amidohydrolase